MIGMSFLRSVIADARPRKPMAQPLDKYTVKTALHTRGLDEAASGADEMLPSTSDETSHPSPTLPIRENTKDFGPQDAPPFQEGNPPSLDVQEMASSNAPESLFSMPGDGSGPVPGQTSSTYPNAGKHSDRGPGAAPEMAAGTERPVKRDIRDMAGADEPDRSHSVAVDASGPIADEPSATFLSAGDSPPSKSESVGHDASRAAGSKPRRPAGKAEPGSRTSSPTRQGHDHSAVASELHGVGNQASGHERMDPASFPAGLRTTLAKEKNDNLGITAVEDQESGRRLGHEKTQSSAGQEGTPALDEADGEGPAGDRRRSGNPPRAQPSGQARARDDVAGDNFAGRTEPGTALTGGAKAQHAPASIGELGESGGLSNQAKRSQSREAESSKGALRDVSRVSRQAVAAEPQVPSDRELASGQRLAGKKKSESAAARAPGLSGSGSPAKHTARPIGPSPSPEAPRAVPAGPRPTELSRNAVESRAPLRSREARHEAPEVRIGQIDVIVEAPARSASKPAPKPSPVDLASRHYLRRL